MLLLHPQLALDRKIQEQVKTDLLPLLLQMREEKNGVWRPQSIRYERIWGGLHDQNAYRGRNKLYLTTGRRILENWVQKLKNDMFPESGRYFECIPDLVTDEDKVPTLTALMRRFVRRDLQLRRMASPFLRTVVTVGTNFSDLGWEVREAILPTLAPLMDQATGQMTKATQVKAEHTLQKIGPTLRAVSPYLMYVWPVTANNLSEAQLIVEDFLMDRDTLARLTATPIHPDAEELGTQAVRQKQVSELLRTARTDPDKYQAEAERLRQRGFRSRSDSTRVDPGAPFDACRFYWKTRVGDDPDPVWYQGILACDEILLSFRRDIWWHLLPSYDAAIFLRREHEFWGIPLPAVFDHLQYFLNDVLNQTGDGLVFSLNPIVALDSNAVQEPTSIRHKPGARWLMRDPRNSISWLEPPKDTPSMGMQTMNVLIALMNDVANVAPYGGAGLTGPRARGRAVNTATGATIITNEAQLQVREVESCLEDEWLNLILYKTHAITLQCLDRPLMLRLDGVRAATVVQKQVTRADLLGRFEWRWLGSVNTYNQSVRSAQMLQMLQIVGRPDIQQALAQQGKRVEVDRLIETLWNEGFDHPDADRIITDIQPQTSIDPTIENDLFTQGLGPQVQVSPADNHVQHLQVHDQILPRLDPIRAAAVQQHMQQHIQAAIMMQVKQQLQQQMAQQQPMQGPPGPGQLPGGNRIQLGSGQQPGRTASTTNPADVMRQQQRMMNGPTLPGVS